jgi:hypothetical protein
MSDQSIIAYVKFINSGNLPARNVHNEVKIRLFNDGEKRVVRHRCLYHSSSGGDTIPGPPTYRIDQRGLVLLLRA